MRFIIILLTALLLLVGSAGSAVAQSEDSTFIFLDSVPFNITLPSGELGTIWLDLWVITEPVDSVVSIMWEIHDQFGLLYSTTYELRQDSTGETSIRPAVWFRKWPDPGDMDFNGSVDLIDFIFLGARVFRGGN